MILQIEIDGRMEKVELLPSPAANVYLVHIQGQVFEANACLLQPGVLSLLLGGRSYRCILDRNTESVALFVQGRNYEYRADDPRSLRTRRARADSVDGARPVKASMPGRVVRVLVETGAEVEAQQGILVIEAMKMQNELKAPKAGRVAEIRVQPGEPVSSGQVLAVIE